MKTLEEEYMEIEVTFSLTVAASSGNRLRILVS